MKATEPSRFGERLRRHRQAAGLTQEELAARAGLTAKGVAALESGRRRHPYPQTVRALAEALGLDEAERGALIGATQPEDGAVPVPPAPPTPTVGRDRELTQVLALINQDDRRLVTLTGPGGVGKTRLALEVARQAANTFPDGIVFVPLAPITDPGLLVPTVIANLTLAERANHWLIDDLAAYLRGRHLLLVLDNLEHLLPAAEDLAALLAASPALTILATSRAPLRIQGEREYPVAPLALPKLVHLPTREEVVRADAVRLFAERARDAAPAFTLTQENAAAVAAIARRLDGLPLAIELAAARMRLLTPTELLARLDKALPLLAGGPRDLPERQRTMQQTIAWSYRLLSGPEQALFRRLSIFADSWDAAAVEAIGTDADLVDVYPIDVLSALVEHSLVVVEPDGGTTRYRMLETIREFGQAQLHTSGERDEVARRHARWYLKLAQAALAHYYGPEEADWLDRLERDHANLRAAVLWAAHDTDQPLLFGLVAALGRFWHKRGHFGEGMAWMDRALHAVRQTLPTTEGATVLFNLGRLSWDRGDRAVGVALLHESLAAWNAAGADAGAASAAIVLADMLRLRGDSEEAAALLHEARSTLERLGNEPFWLSTNVRVLGIMALERGEWSHAEALMTEALATARESKYPWAIASALHNLGHLVHLLGDHERSIALYRESLELSAAQRDHWSVAVTLPALAQVLAALGEPERAIRLLGAAEGLREALATRLATVPVVDGYDEAIDRLRTSVGVEVFEMAWRDGRSLAPDAAVREATEAVERRLRSVPGAASQVKSPPGGLSPREVEVLRLVATGMTNAQVADRLYLSRRTVDAHLRRIYDRLDLSSRAEAIRFAIEQGLA